MNNNNDKNLEEKNSSEEQILNNECSKNSLGKLLYVPSMSKSMQQVVKSFTILQKSLVPRLKQQEQMRSIATSVRKIPTQIEKVGLDLINSSISNYYQGIANNLVESTKTLMPKYTPSISESIKNFVSYKFDIAHRIQSPIQQMLHGIDFSPLYSILKSLIDFSKYKEKFNRIIITETYEAKWFPHALCINDRRMVVEFWNILDSTRKSKNRIKRIDKLVFRTYDKKRIESMKKEWRKKDIPEYKMRMMHQAVQAYHRREYAITVVVLSTLWEGIIYDKANDTRRKIGRYTKENFKKLLLRTDYNKLFMSFFDEYIMYNCESVEEVKEDVPGRNSSAHSWYNKYPSRKAALNAILFTDFLLDIEPLEHE